MYKDQWTTLSIKIGGSDEENIYLIPQSDFSYATSLWIQVKAITFSTKNWRYGEMSPITKSIESKIRGFLIWSFNDHDWVLFVS